MFLGSNPRSRSEYELRLVYISSFAIYTYIHIYWYSPLMDFWSSYRKWAWVGFEPTTTEFRSDALIDWAIRPWVHGSGNVRCDRQNLLSFWAIFCPFSHLTTQKIKILKNWMKKMPEDVINLQMCTINDNHMMYGSWDLECNRQNFLSFWTVFALLPSNNPKSKILKKWKKLLEILSFYICVL